MLDLTWIANKQLITPTGKNSWTFRPVDNIGIEDAIRFIQKVNLSDGMHMADKTASLSRYSRLGLTITPAYLDVRGSNTGRRRRIHPLGLIQYITASMMINGLTFSTAGGFVECAKAREADVFYGSLCFYIKELDNLRKVLPMDQRDTLNITKIFDKDILGKLPQFSMATDIAAFEKLRAIYIDTHVRPVYQDDTDSYTSFWEMMYYRTISGCFSRYMDRVLYMACGY